MRVVSVAGGSGAGKTSLVTEALRQLGTGLVAIVAHDAYYLDLSDLPMSERARSDFDSPDALETSLLLEHLDVLIEGTAVELPCYDFKTHTRLPVTRRIEPRPVLFIEGLHALGHEGLRKRSSLDVFVDAGAELRLERRLARDRRQRGRTEASIRRQWNESVQPMFERHILPTKRHADLVLDGAAPIEELFEQLRSRLGV